MRHFGATSLAPSIVKDAYDRDKGYAFVTNARHRAHVRSPRRSSGSLEACDAGLDVRACGCGSGGEALTTSLEAVRRPAICASPPRRPSGAESSNVRVSRHTQA
jgi:hypothetical protein